MHVFIYSFIFNFYFRNRKYEEIKPPEVEDFCYITDNTYSKEEVILVLMSVFLLSYASAWFVSLALALANLDSLNLIFLV